MSDLMSQRAAVLLTLEDEKASPKPSCAVVQACETALRVLDRALRRKPHYKCVQGHDLCHTMLPCKECPYCELQ